MAGILRFNPFEDFFTDFSKGGLFMKPLAFPHDAEVAIKIDVKEDEKSFTVKADIPGVKKDEKVAYSERSYGMASRTFSLPAAVDAKTANAECKDGVPPTPIPPGSGSGEARRVHPRDELPHLGVAIRAVGLVELEQLAEVHRRFVLVESQAVVFHARLLSASTLGAQARSANRRLLKLRVGKTEAAAALHAGGRARQRPSGARPEDRQAPGSPARARRHARASRSARERRPA